MRWLDVRWQRCWETIGHQVKGIVPGIVVPRWLLPGLLVLSLLALGASAISQHRMLHTSPQQHISARSNSIPPVPADPSPTVSAGKAYLGIRGKTFVQGQVRGVKVLDVFPGSPAARAGLRADRDRLQGAGHVIIGVDGQPVHSEEDLAQIMARLSAGAQAQLFLTNTTGKTSEVISVTLGTAPETPANADGAAMSGSSLSAALGYSSATSAPILPWPGARPESRQSDKRVSEVPVKTPGGTIPVGWGGQLMSPPLKTVGSKPPDVNSALLEVAPDLIDAYIDRLEITPVQGTRLVKIAFSTPDPELAARVANMHARAYLEQGIELRSHANDEARQFLREKLAEYKNRLEKSEAALHRYRQDKGIISFENRDNIVIDRLADLSKRLTEAEADRIGLEAQTRLIRQNEYNALPAVINNRLIQTLKIELTHLEGERADLATQVQARDPALDQLKARVEQTKRRLQQEIQRTVAGIKSAYTAAKQKEDELRAKVEQQKAAALGLKDAAVDYAILAREVDTNRQLYDSVLSRFKEMEVTAALRASNVSVIDQAVSPVKPVRPRKVLSLLLSAVLGLTGGVGLAFVVEHFNNTLRTSQEVERYLRLPNLGIIPDFVSSARRRSPSSHPASPDAQRRDDSAAPAAFVLAHDPFSITTEAYRMLRTTLLVAPAETSPKTLLFTSGMHGEGKTVTAVNTAAVLAQMGVRVLVIDADLRCSACHTVLGIENKAGLVEVLAGRWDPSDVIRPTVSEHLFLLSSGSVPRNPAELVGSKQMRAILASLQEQYDYILIDSPPVMLASDAMLLSTVVDGVVLVANAQRTPKQVVREARTRLTCARAKLLGVVLNQLNIRNREYAYYYRKYAPAA
jgi:succinoglycan biosynthesis transport protein ExoP